MSRYFVNIIKDIIMRGFIFKIGKKVECLMDVSYNYSEYKNQ